MKTEAMLRSVSSNRMAKLMNLAITNQVNHWFPLLRSESAGSRFSDHRFRIIEEIAKFNSALSLEAAIVLKFIRLSQEKPTLHWRRQYADQCRH